MDGWERLHMANNLHEPEYADEFDDYFDSRGEINLRKWEQYGFLAQHRRELADSQGLKDWEAPACQINCTFGCQSIKSAPTAKGIKEWMTARPAESI
jgi:hypothetical protein